MWLLQQKERFHEFPENPIFNGINEEEYNELAAPGCVRTSRYAKDQAVFSTGDQTTAFGILLSGELHIENIDLWGNRIILHNISAGEAFAETYALSRIPMMVDVTASRDSEILFLDLENCWMTETAAGRGTQNCSATCLSSPPPKTSPGPTGCSASPPGTSAPAS